MVSWLVHTDFDTVVSLIQQMDPLSSFETAPSHLLLEESRRAQEAPNHTQSSIVANDTPQNSAQTQT